MATPQIQILKETREYLVLQIPRRFMPRGILNTPKLTQTQALKVLRAGMTEYKMGKTKKLDLETLEILLDSKAMRVLEKSRKESSQGKGRELKT